ncbi:MAG: pilus assembly protein [Alphaproteobacteria bacterium]|nr:pilus assembly protein [Alphaproteobacteria bacterium]MBU1513716.1 pilus assembly protein [Alphaproteobacteria bacterium]MBU2094639.1 pilus assembly protein [Alphaproteobacteria bacterium]MBU2150292.1 pilus assembly protein [Alphaproteobacteria bacterium]MBU2309179.1 pilus assembly protein [Alphaproteobacteria bacterium]
MIVFLRRLAADRKGASAVEFALILPILFLLHIGAAEALQAYVAQRNVAHIASTMADITARNRTISNAELNDVLSASVAVMYPFPSVRLQQRVSSISADGSGTITTDWTAKKDYTAAGSPSLPQGYLRSNESVIVTDVIYDYKPTFGFFLPDTIRMVRHAYVRPRLSAKVEKVS